MNQNPFNNSFKIPVKIKQIKICDFCESFNTINNYYLIIDCNNSPNVYILRKYNTYGGLKIDYCPICGRKL